MGPLGVRRRVWLRWLVVLLVLAGIVPSVVHLVVVHGQYGVWGWSLHTPTPRIPFHGRRYMRGTDEISLTQGFVRLGTVTGGGQVFGPSVTYGQTPTGLEVRYPDGRIVAYALSGGP